MDWESIMKMEPGREMDELVRQYVTHYISPSNAMNPDGTFGHLPAYSTDISAAWEVVEKFEDRIKIESWVGYIIKICDPICIQIHGKTFPETICKAALLTVWRNDFHD